MDSLERLMRAAPLPRMLTTAAVSVGGAALQVGGGGGAAGGVPGAAGAQQRALVHASLAAATVGRKGRHLTGTFCLTGDTMEGIIQCLVFLKAFSVSGGYPGCYPLVTGLPKGSLRTSVGIPAGGWGPAHFHRPHTHTATPSLGTIQFSFRFALD